ncbi:transmembrane protein 202-like [Gracilinanus agilis]|uniref:transmembrane protein 202-like n=1 Tax=Gracilinanus agilis TaxID=191870 RepID=UPI001CFCD754|nr:transmembrane protein 202-like [Gracilinanus agilis]
MAVGSCSGDSMASVTESDSRILSFQNSYVPTYRPVQPIRIHHLLCMTRQKQQFLDQSRLYSRIFCISLCGISFLLMLCISPLPWIHLVELKNSFHELHVGLWTLCNHTICWDHTPRSPYNFQIPRILYLISAIISIITVTWLCISIYKSMESIYLDLGAAIAIFISGTCLLFSLIMFLVHTKRNTRHSMATQYLWTYYLTWGSNFFYLLAGLISLFNYVRSRSPTRRPHLTVFPLTRSRVNSMTSMELDISETKSPYPVSSKGLKSMKYSSSLGSGSRPRLGLVTLSRKGSTVFGRSSVDPGKGIVPRVREKMSMGESSSSKN